MDPNELRRAEAWLDELCASNPALAAELEALGHVLVERRSTVLLAEDARDWLIAWRTITGAAGPSPLERLLNADVLRPVVHDEEVVEYELPGREEVVVVMLRWLRASVDREGRRFPTGDQLVNWARHATGFGAIEVDRLDAPTPEAMVVRWLPVPIEEGLGQAAILDELDVLEELLEALALLVASATVEDVGDLARLLDVWNRAVRTRVLLEPLLVCRSRGDDETLAALLDALGAEALRHRGRWEAFEFSLGTDSARVAWLPSKRFPAATSALKRWRLAILRALAAEDPTSDWRLAARSELLNEAALALEAVDDAAAAALYVEMIAAMRRLCATRPDSIGLAHGLSCALKGASSTHRRLDRVVEARAFATEDLVLARSLVEREPGSDPLKVGLALAHYHQLLVVEDLGERLGHLAEARRILSEAQEAGGLSPSGRALLAKLAEVESAREA